MRQLRFNSPFEMNGISFWLQNAHSTVMIWTHRVQYLPT